MQYKTVDCDVLVIGAGGAGLRAAIAAHDRKAKPIVVSKTLLGKSHTVMAEGGVNAALGNVDKDDNWQMHFRDTIVEGRFISDCRLVELLVKKAPKMILELERWGAVFDRTAEGKIDQRFFGAHTYRRACYTGDRIGLEIIRTLEDQIRSRNIKVMEEVAVTKLFVENNSIKGAFAVDIKSGEPIVFTSKAVVLATGGAGRVFKISTNSLEAIGDGYALALQAGCQLQDMEMIQFHPTGMVYPDNVRGMLVTEAVRGEGGVLLNAKNERFMEKYDKKRMELSARDVVARAIYHEIEEGRGTANGGVYLDIKHLGKDYIRKKLPRMQDQFMVYAGIDITQDLMEVAPSAHYTMGGIRVNTDCSTNISGLFAAGEAAAGVHGANRLGGNSLIDILVFGEVAGESSSVYAKGAQPSSISEKEIDAEYARITSFFNKEGSSPYALRKSIQQVMWEYVGIMRNESRLRRALEELAEIKLHAGAMSVKGDMKYNPEWMEATNVLSMLHVCEAIVRSALMRKESRGAHFREDYPQEDSKWLLNIVCSLDKGKMTLSTKDIFPMRKELAKSVETGKNERIEG